MCLGLLSPPSLQNPVLSKMAAFLLATAMLEVRQDKGEGQKDSLSVERDYGWDFCLTLSCVIKAGKALSCWAWGFKDHLVPAALVKLNLQVYN